MWNFNPQMTRNSRKGSPLVSRKCIPVARNCIMVSWNCVLVSQTCILVSWKFILGSWNCVSVAENDQKFKKRFTTGLTKCILVFSRMYPAFLKLCPSFLKMYPSFQNCVPISRKCIPIFINEMLHDKRYRIMGYLISQKCVMVSVNHETFLRNQETFSRNWQTFSGNWETFSWNWGPFMGNLVTHVTPNTFYHKAFHR